MDGQSSLGLSPPIQVSPPTCLLPLSFLEMAELHSPVPCPQTTVTAPQASLGRTCLLSPLCTFQCGKRAFKTFPVYQPPIGHHSGYLASCNFISSASVTLSPLLTCALVLPTAALSNAVPASHAHFPCHRPPFSLCTTARSCVCAELPVGTGSLSL